MSVAICETPPRPPRPSSWSTLQWDLGGLAYEMAIRDHFRLDVLTRQAAKLQQVDAELAEVERMLKLDQAGAAGACGNCGALYAQGVGLLLAVRQGPDAAGHGRDGGGSVIGRLRDALAPRQAGPGKRDAVTAGSCAGRRCRSPTGAGRRRWRRSRSASASSPASRSAPAPAARLRPAPRRSSRFPVSAGRRRRRRRRCHLDRRRSRIEPRARRRRRRRRRILGQLLRSRR